MKADGWAMGDCVFSGDGVGALLGYWSCWMVEGWQLMDASKMEDDGWLDDGING